MTAKEPQIWFVFNELSGRIPARTVHEGRKRMNAMVSALATVMAGRATTFVTVGEPNLWEVELASGHTVSDWLTGADPDLRNLILAIASKSGIPEEANEALRGRYCLSEFVLADGPEGRSQERLEARGLGAAFLFAGIGVSLLSEDRWSRIQIPLRHTWLDEACQEKTSDVEALNLSDASQLERLSEVRIERSRRGLRGTPLNLPASKRKCFPHLAFGLDVDSHLKTLPQDIFPSVINKLVTLDDASHAWRADRAMTFPILPKCHDESEPTMQRFGSQRRFRDQEGNLTLYKLHAMVGSAYRIHLRVIHDPRGIEIGYIGRHLDTVRHH